MLAIHHDPGKARIRPSLLATLVLLGGLVATAALQLFTLGGTVVRSFQPVFVDAPALEEQIAEWAAARDDQPFHVTCPVEGIAFDRHDVFTCEATSTFGSAWDIEVTVEKGETFSWRLADALPADHDVA